MKTRYLTRPPGPDLFPGRSPFRLSFPAAAAGSLLRMLAKVILPLPMHLLYGLKYSGGKNLRGIRNTGAITVSNHCQYMEPVFTGLACWNRRVLFVVEENNVTRKDIGWLNRLMGAVGIPDDNPMAIAPEIKAALEDRCIVHFYPEGKLFFRNQKLRPFHGGAFYFSLKYNIPLVPMTEVLKPRPLRRLLPFLPPRVEFIIGEPIYPDRINGTSLGPNMRAKLFALEVRNKMQALIDSVNGGGRV